MSNALSRLLINTEELGVALERAAILQNDSTGSDASLELAKFWLDNCVDSHYKCRQHYSPGEDTWLPTRLIDVANDTIRLIETKDSICASNDRRYVSLSHCWGKIQIIRTLSENLDDHKDHIDPSTLSKTFREAIHVTRKLGFRYIWIDSLCIIQDNKSDWETEAATMCDVYRNAVFKIAAASAPGGNVGCFHARDGLAQWPFLVKLPYSLASKSENGTAASPKSLVFTSYGRTQPFMVEPPLYGRSWVLQEQLLSPRMLIFDGPQLRWECNTSHGSERTPLGGLSRHIGYQKVVRTGIFNDGEFFTIPDMENKENAARYQLQYWAHAIMDYTHRGMTHASDRLIAIEGIAQALSRHTTKKYYAGLWDQDLWLGLLWSISHANEYTPTTTDAFDMENNKHVRHEEETAPSWSWVSVTVPVVYPVPDMVYMHRMCNVLSVQVSGTSARKSGTLKISGHVRTGFVDAMYPYSNRDAALFHPSMTARKPKGTKDFISYRGRGIRPTDYFVFSDTSPDTLANRLSGGQNWRLIRGVFRPDEVIPPHTCLTFLAIAQWNIGIDLPSIARKHRAHDPVQVWTLALVPTGRADDEYRRVGYAVWEDCAWYGYVCGVKKQPGRVIEREAGWRGFMVGMDLEQMGWGGEEVGKGHEHGWVKHGELPAADRYGRRVTVAERLITIV